MKRHSTTVRFIIGIAALIIFAPYPLAAVASAQDPLPDQNTTTGSPAGTSVSDPNASPVAPSTDLTTVTPTDPTSPTSDNTITGSQNTASNTPVPATDTTPQDTSQTTGSPASAPDSTSLATSTNPAGTTDLMPNTANPLPSSLNGSQSANLNNSVTSGAQSGNATVSGNTAAGDAQSGNAEAAANILNFLQSSVGLGGPVNLFSADINGNVYGDLVISPSTIGGQALPVTASPGNVDVNLATNNTIHNTVDLSAASGNADVSGNTSAGNAKPFP